MMPPHIETPRYTYLDYKQWKEPWELIAGFPYSMLPSAVFWHQKVAGNIAFAFKMSLGNGACSSCEVLMELDWIIDEHTVVRPDVMVICGKKPEKFLEYPPTIIVEVLSKSTLKKDRGIKFSLYESLGVRYYIMADPDKKTVEAFVLKNNRYQEMPLKNTLHLQVNESKPCNIGLDTDKLFE